MIGHKYNRLLVIARSGAGSEGAKWLCRCDCGNTVIVYGVKLRHGRTKSCGCLAVERSDRAAIPVGSAFGRLIVIAEAPRGDYSRMWRCACECGSSTIVATDVLRTGKARSCGCLRQETTRARFAVHGRTGSREYKSWQAMIQRCTNSNNPNWKDYGGRGIGVCERWLNSFVEFMNDMGARPATTSLDRINNNGNYEPGNCRWATVKEQARNKRLVKLEPHEPAQIRWLVAEGYPKTQIARFFAVSASTVHGIAEGRVWR